MLFVDSAIKKKCCVDVGVPTQVILHRNIIRDNVKSVATKVALQMNCKLGGAPWTVDIPVQVRLCCSYLNVRSPSI
jgi:aubergine-like protein